MLTVVFPLLCLFACTAPCRGRYYTSTNSPRRIFTSITATPFLSIYPSGGMTTTVLTLRRYSVFLRLQIYLRLRQPGSVNVHHYNHPLSAFTNRNTTSTSISTLVSSCHLLTPVRQTSILIHLRSSPPRHDGHLPPLEPDERPRDRRL